MTFDGDRDPATRLEKPKRRPMDMESIGRAVLLFGVGAAVLGGILLLLSRVPGLNQLFNLPGDIRIETGNVSCFFPIVSMILLSILLTVIANIVIRLLNR
jgi:hypothetical protein